jgi:hypothetical protein
VSELTWIIDSAGGQMTVEGLGEEAPSVIGDLLPPGVPVNCARPRTSELLAPANSNLPGVRIARIYHGSVVDGPGRRSVVQFQGCPIRCPGFIYSLDDAARGTEEGLTL